MSGTTCAICLEDAKSPVVTPCGHMHCEQCLLKCIELSDDAVDCLCPTCRAPFTIANPDLRFVPPKYHAFMQPSVRRVYPSPSDVVQTLEKQNDKLHGDNAKLRDRYDSLKRKNEHLQRDKQRLMDSCEASQAAVANYREKERQLRDDIDTISDERDALEKEASDWERKYREVREKYSKLKKVAAEDKQTASSSQAKKRSSTQAALENSPGEGLSNSHSSKDRRPIAPIPKRPRLAAGKRPVIDISSVRLQPGSLWVGNRTHASIASAPSSAAYVGQKPQPLQSGLTLYLDSMDVSADTEPDLDEEEKDGPSKIRHRSSLAGSSQSSQASQGSSSQASSSQASSSRASFRNAFAAHHASLLGQHRPPQARARGTRSPWDPFMSDEGSQGNLDFSLGSSPAIPPAEDEEDAQGRAYVFRGRRVRRAAVDV